MNESQFDDLLQDLADTPPAEITEELSPWRNAMSRIIWGIGWTTITLNFLNLEYLLPCIGVIMILLGFRSLRQENRWFSLGYGCAWVKLLWWMLIFAVDLTALRDDASLLAWRLYGAYAMFLPETLILLCLRNGIRAVQRKAGLPEEGGTGLLVFRIVSMSLAIIGLTGILALIFIIVYILMLRELYKLSGKLDEAGYAISPAPVSVSDTAAKRLYTAAIAVIVLVCYLFLSRYPMNWQPVETVSRPETETVRQELVSLGFPAEILGDMTEEEILACSGTDFVLVEVKEVNMNRGRASLQSLDDTENILQITFVGLRFPEEQERWKLIHHFRWLSGDGFCGTEAIQMWPAYRSEHWNKAGTVTGRVLYDRTGDTYCADYRSLETMIIPGWFGPSEDLYATFSFPARGENQRGYLIYDVTNQTEGASVNSWFNYVHQYSRIQFPVRTAMEREMNGNSNNGWGFVKDQNEFRFSTYGEIPELF